MCHLKRAVLLLGLAGCVLFVSLSATEVIASEGAGFNRLASARIEIRENLIDEINGLGETTVTIRVRGAIPHHFYTVWLRMKDFSPLTNGHRSTPLAPLSAIPDLVRVTDRFDLAPQVAIPDDHCSGPPNDPPLACPGTRDVINGFLTNAAGNATFTITVDFPLSAGVYPFDRLDPSLFDQPVNLFAVALKRAADDAGGTVRVVSHLTDPPGLEAHGLIAGPNEIAIDFVIP